MVLNFSDKQKNEPLIHDGSKNKVTKYVNIAKIEPIAFNTHSNTVIAFSAASERFGISSAKTLSPNAKYITVKKPR